MLLRNAEILNCDFNPEKADVAIEGGVISAIGPGISAGGETIDLTGCVLVPGFIDIHTHGCAGFDTCDATPEAISGMAARLALHGVTSFCPTTMTIAPEGIAAALANIRACAEKGTAGAAARGVNLEGPYLSAGRKGSQKEADVRAPDWTQFRYFYDISGGMIKLVDIAPERAGADEFIARAKSLCRVSMAHTEADYGTAKAAFAKGVSHVTHLFNAMTGLNHREPGAVGAVFDDDTVTAELICDGFHIHPAVLRIAFRLLGEDRTIIVSDAMRAAGLPDGAYDLGGQTVDVRAGRARLADGTIAGSTTNLHQEIKNLVGYGVPFRQVIKSATINPAKAIGEDGRIGSIKAGKDADLVALDKDLNIRLVIIRGKVGGQT